MAISGQQTSDMEKERRPIAKLYSLEVSSGSNKEVTEAEVSTTSTAINDELANTSGNKYRPTRSSATKAQQNIGQGHYFRRPRRMSRTSKTEKLII